MSDSLAILRTRHDSEEVKLESTYRLEFVEALKAAVPHTDREAVYEPWDEVVEGLKKFKHWTFRAFWWDRVVALVRDHYFEAYHEHTNEAGEVEKTDLITGARLGMFTTHEQE